MAESQRIQGDEPADTPRGLEVMPLGRADEGPAISPRMHALFGGMFGLAVVASIVALLIQVFPVVDQRAVIARGSVTGPVATGGTAGAPTQPKKRQRTILPGPWRITALQGSHLIVKGQMKRRSFILALGEAGVPKAQVYRILKSQEGVRKYDRTGRRDQFSVAMTRGTKQVVAFEYEVSPTEIYQSRTDKEGLLKSTRLDMKVRHEDYAASFYIGPDLTKSYLAASLEKGLLREIDKAFNGRTSHEAFEEGGVVKVIVVETTALGRFVRHERIKALEYRPPDPEKKPLRAYWLEGDQTKGYVDDRGRRPSHRGWRSPIPGAPITSHFNRKRLHPILKRVIPHNGTDYGCGAGTPIYAAYRGTVTLVGVRGGFGNQVLIGHPGGIETGYAHMSRFAKGLKRGDKVGTRQLIGYVGSTGRSTGPHLHFSTKRNGKYFDSRELKMDSLQLLPVTERAAFLEQKQALDRALEALPMPEPPAEEPAPSACRRGRRGRPHGPGPVGRHGLTESASPPGTSGTIHRHGDADVPSRAGGPGRAATGIRRQPTVGRLFSGWCHGHGGTRGVHPRAGAPGRWRHDEPGGPGRLDRCGGAANGGGRHPHRFLGGPSQGDRAVHLGARGQPRAPGRAPRGEHRQTGKSSRSSPPAEHHRAAEGRPKLRLD
ncbi:MAG: M23 family metallopeptidase [Deltaproteobacteria bacterium]|nr:M23 family metallopeptidase [Deltaproteobacteria bacterium]